MSEKRERYLTLEDARALLTASATSDDPQLPLARTLHERGLLSDADFRVLESEVRRAQGNLDALIEHADGGGELDSAQAAAIFSAAIGAGPRSSLSLNMSIGMVARSLAENLDIVLRAIEQSTDPDQLAVAIGALLKSSAPESDSATVGQVASTALRKLATTAGDLSGRKRRALQVLESVWTLEPPHFQSILDDALKLGPLRSFDIATHSMLGDVIRKSPGCCLVMVKRANSETDLHAVTELLGRVRSPRVPGDVIHQLLKRYGEAIKPTSAAAEALAGALAPLVAMHEQSPSSGAASHDAAALKRWSNQFPHLQDLASAAQQIEAARAIHKPTVQAEIREQQRMERAIRFIKDVVIPNGGLIIAVGGKKSPAAHEAFDEFGKSPPNWGEWVTKEYFQALNNYQIKDLIESPKCMGVLVITKPASHALTNQAKDAAMRANRPIVWIEEATKKKIREGMKTLVERIKQQANPSPERRSA